MPETNRGPDPRAPDADSRLQRLEEHLAFAEHAIESLGADLTTLSRRHADLQRRFDALEVARRAGDAQGQSDSSAPDPAA